MTTFALFSAALIAAALLFVLLPLLRRPASTQDVSTDRVNINIYRDQLRELDEDLAAATIDQARHAEARAELERRLLDDTTADSKPGVSPAPRAGKLTAAIFAATLPLAATGLYLMVGTPEGLKPQQVAGAGHEITPQQIEQMVEKLAARLKASPEDGEGWVMLGRTYAMLDRFNESAAAYGEAARRVPGDAQLLVDYADVLAMAQGRRLAGEPEKLVQRALAIDPENPKALALAGSAAFEQKQYATAILHWQKLVAALPPNSEIANAVQGSIAEARSLGGGSAKPEIAKPAPAQQSAPALAKVSGSVQLSAALQARVAPNDSVYIFARAANGPPAPLAVLRKRVADLPVQFVLDESMAMAPDMNLSRFDTVIVGARISKSGMATRQPGDFEGYSATIKVGTTGVTVVVDNEVR
ncbi:MAG: c-type cytochrome biogenesis protein CcmI [Burkholderiales bacterium]|nr:c-type cytochrome biogenesis protein CcmI [Burkholderiales bacterium]